MNITPRFCLFALLALILLGCQSTPATSQADRPAVSTLPVMLQEADDAQPPARFDDSAPRAAALAFAETLTDEQKKQTLLPIDDKARKAWHYVPRDRPGIKLGDMTDAQKHTLHALLQTGLSDAGYLKVTDIVWLEIILAELENNPNYRDVGKYHVLIFGDPGEENSAWGWRFEGHHVSINFMYTDAGIAVTPMFLGTNPAVVPSGPLAGKRVLADEHNLALELVQSLSEAQLEKATIAQKPRDVITGPGREATLDKPVGIDTNALNDQQNQKLNELFWPYLQNLKQEHYLHLVMRTLGYSDDGQESPVHFAWAGPTDGSGPFYYRIHSPTFVIEYTMQGKNHVHSVFHDLTDPLGEDLLKKHYELHEHGEQ